MSSQHRRSKVNHSLIVGPELTEHQQRIVKSRKKLTKMTTEELGFLLEACNANVKFWKNRRSVRLGWETSVLEVEKEISKRPADQSIT